MVWMTACATQQHPLPPPGQPDPGLVERVSVPYDPAYRRAVVVVEPLELAAHKKKRADAPAHTGWGNWGWSMPKTAQDDDDCCSMPPQPEATLANALTVDLVRALNSIGNVTLIDYEQYIKTPDPRTLVPHGYVGPFIIGGTVEEFGEKVDNSYIATGSVLGTIGTAMSIAGAVIGEPGLTWGGVGLAALSPALDYRVTRRTGSVQLEMRIYDSKAGIIAATITPEGTSTDKSGLNGFALFGFGQPKPQYSLSLLGRAHRNAFNNVTNDVWGHLKPLL